MVVLDALKEPLFATVHTHTRTHTHTYTNEHTHTVTHTHTDAHTHTHKHKHEHTAKSHEFLKSQLAARFGRPKNIELMFEKCLFIIT